MPLIIHSESTKEYARQIAEQYTSAKLIHVNVIDRPKPIDDLVIGIGGGKVIDYAKVMAGKKRAIVYPTTAAGAAATSHAVYWDTKKNKKMNISTMKPEIRIEPSFLQNIPRNILEMTSYDALGQSLDSYWSKKATPYSKALSRRAHEIINYQIEHDYEEISELIHAGNMAGKAIEITTTNMTHAISYPLTLSYKVPHGLGVGWAIPFCARYQECDLPIPIMNIKIPSKVSIKKIAREAIKYPKIHQAKKDINEKTLYNLLRNKI